MGVAAAAILAGCRTPGGGAAARSGDFPVVVIETSAGTVKAELWPDKAPVTVENFLRYVDEEFYDDTIFHRCIRGFMIQGGGFTIQPTAEGTGTAWVEKQTREAIRNEADNGVRNMRGTLAMARTGEIHSATSQFFINTVDNRALDHGVRDFGYAVFGQVISGMGVVDRIERAPVLEPASEGKPVQPVVIRSIRRGR